jgi:hypothetical protein
LQLSNDSVMHGSIPYFHWFAGNQASIKAEAQDSVFCEDISCKARQREHTKAGERLATMCGFPANQQLQCC